MSAITRATRKLNNDRHKDWVDKMSFEVLMKLIDVHGDTYSNDELVSMSIDLTNKMLKELGYE